MYHVLEDGNTELLDGKLVMEMLDTARCYILDCKNEIYVWIGKSSGKEYRNVAMDKASEMLNQTSADRAPWTEIFRVAEGGEPVLFCEKVDCYELFTVNSFLTGLMVPHWVPPSM